MREINSNFSRVKEKYLKFIKSQEVLGEPFRDKISQLNNFIFRLVKRLIKIIFVIKKLELLDWQEGKVRVNQL